MPALGAGRGPRRAGRAARINRPHRPRLHRPPVACPPMQHGILAGGLADGTVCVWDPAILMKKAEGQAQLAKLQKHTGTVSSSGPAPPAPPAPARPCWDGALPPPASSRQHCAGTAPRCSPHPQLPRRTHPRQRPAAPCAAAAALSRTNRAPTAGQGTGVQRIQPQPAGVGRVGRRALHLGHGEPRPALAVPSAPGGRSARGAGPAARS